MDSEPSEYRIVSRSKDSSRVEEIDLGISESSTTRQVLRAEIVRNKHDTGKSVKIAIVHQRRANKDADWEDLGGTGLGSLKAGDAAKISLDTEQTWALAKHLNDLYEVGVDGLVRGKVIAAVGVDVVKAAGERAETIRALLEADHGEEVWAALAAEKPVLASQVALAHLYQQRKAVVDEFEANVGLKKGEEYWQKLLAKNRWIFGNCYIACVGERRINIKETMDHPLIAEDGCLEIVEIKKPELPFWQQKDGGTFLYRSKYPIPYWELTGAIAQSNGYVFAAEKEVDSVDWRKRHSDVPPVKPRALVVHGRSADWGDTEQETYRLLNDMHHGVTVITFDHLLTRAKQSLASFSPEGQAVEVLTDLPEEAQES